MIDYTSVRQTIEKHLGSNFSTCPMQRENVAINERQPNEYISLYDTITQSETISVGVVKCNGMLTITINTKLGIGTNRSREIAENLDSLLANQEISDIVFKESELKSLPIKKDARHYQQVLLIPYIFAYNGTI